jgi:general secretion pathway protein J
MTMRPPRRIRAIGFTLIEVLVALFIMAVLAGMAFRGVDAIARAKDGAQAATSRTLRLATGISQFEIDVSQIVDTYAVPTPLAFDGGTLRLTRRTPGGVQLVVWTLQDRRWQRWASPAVTQFGALAEQWMRSQQVAGLADATLTVLPDVDDFQIYFCNPNDPNNPSAGCSWSNAQTSKTVSPTGLRLSLKMARGELTRETELPYWNTFGGTTQ